VSAEFQPSNHLIIRLWWVDFQTCPCRSNQESLPVPKPSKRSETIAIKTNWLYKWKSISNGLKQGQWRMRTDIITTRQRRSSPIRSSTTCSPGLTQMGVGLWTVVRSLPCSRRMAFICLKSKSPTCLVKHSVRTTLLDTASLFSKDCSRRQTPAASPNSLKSRTWTCQWTQPAGKLSLSRLPPWKLLSVTWSSFVTKWQLRSRPTISLWRWTSWWLALWPIWCAQNVKADLRKTSSPSFRTT